LAPWGYGDDFNPDLVPLSLLTLAKKIKNDKNNFDLRPNSLRDITIKLREHGLFKLDPHLDPVSDGWIRVMVRVRVKGNENILLRHC
jgi:flagellar motor component MotA